MLPNCASCRQCNPAPPATTAIATAAPPATGTGCTAAKNRVIVGVPGSAKRKVNPAYTAHTSPFYTAYVCQHPTCLPGTVFCDPECVLKHEHLVA